MDDGGRGPFRPPRRHRGEPSGLENDDYGGGNGGVRGDDARATGGGDFPIDGADHNEGVIDDDPLLGRRLRDRRAVATTNLPPPTSRGQRRGYGDGDDDDDEYEDDYDYDCGDDGRRWRLVDPASSHVRTGTILLPIDMTMKPNEPTNIGGGDRGDVDDDGDGDGDGEAPPLSSSPPSTSPSHPLFSVNSSRLMLRASFPPPLPFPTHPPPMVDGDHLERARRHLARHSGPHVAIGVTSATDDARGGGGGLGYADAMLSLNYRLPSLLSLPSLFGEGNESTRRNRRRRWRRRRRQAWIGDGHCDLRLGGSSSTGVASLGCTARSLDGRTRLRLDACDPFDRRSAAAFSRGGGGVLVSGSRVLSSSGGPSKYHPPLRADLRAELLPSSSSPSRRSSLAPRFDLTLSTFDADDGGGVVSGGRAALQDGRRRRPGGGLSLSLGYHGGEGRRTSSGSASREECRMIGASSPDLRDGHYCRGGGGGASLRLDAERTLSASQTCRSTLGYLHTGHVLSFGTVFRRTIGPSAFSRLGVGVRHSVGDVWNALSSGDGPWWRFWGGRGTTTTSWLFQLERGDVRLLVPVTIGPPALSAQDAFLRVCCAALASAAVDVVAVEFLRGVTSGLRANFLRLLLGEEAVAKHLASLGVEEEDDEDDVQRRSRMDEEGRRDFRRRRLRAERENALRQASLMARQAGAVTAREEARGGLVVVKAAYGAADARSGRWAHRRRPTGDDDDGPAAATGAWHAMDATAQLRFWVRDSSLRLPAVSRRHMLGFYDVVAFAEEDERDAARQTRSGGGGDGVKRDDDGKRHQGFPTFATSWWRETMWPWRSVEEERETKLVAVLSVRYRWGEKTYEATFRDDEAVELPSPFAREVVERSDR